MPAAPHNLLTRDTAAATCRSSHRSRPCTLATTCCGDVHLSISATLRPNIAFIAKPRTFSISLSALARTAIALVSRF